MRYYVIDNAGHFYSKEERFDTYDHNQAFVFKSWVDACVVSRRYRAHVEIL